MTTKQSAVNEAFRAWIVRAKPWDGTPPIEPETVEEAYRDGFAARGAMDIAALDSTTASLTAGHPYFEIIKRAIRALDMEVEDER